MASSFLVLRRALLTKENEQLGGAAETQEEDHTPLGPY